jgi:large subunit ribosomal protein L29
MDASQIREMTDEKILDEIEDLKESMFKLRLQDASGQLENQNVLKETRRDIARLKTVLRERQLAAQHVSGKGS